MSASLARIIRRMAREAGGLRALGRARDIQASYLSRMQNGHQEHPSDAVLKKLGIERVVTYRRR